MQHVWDHYDFTNDKNWYRDVGYPLIKGVAQFHLSTLLEDKYFKDGTLVVNPCNSPEQPPSTFGCAINQQQISEVFMNVLKGWDASGDQDLVFKKKIQNALDRIYSGIRVGRYGQIQGTFEFGYQVTETDNSQSGNWTLIILTTDIGISPIFMDGTRTFFTLLHRWLVWGEG